MAEAFPIPNKDAATVARILAEQVIYRFGAPIAGIYDRGGEVDGQVMREVCRLLDIGKLRTTAYKPSTNGVVDRFHTILNALIGRVSMTGTHCFPMSWRLTEHPDTNQQALRQTH